MEKGTGKGEEGGWWDGMMCMNEDGIVLDRRKGIHWYDDLVMRLNE
jgi:hypothetical protein